jgi:hypothetical protein
VGEAPWYVFFSGLLMAMYLLGIAVHVHVQQELAERGPQIGRQRRARHALQNDLHPRCSQLG